MSDLQYNDQKGLYFSAIVLFLVAILAFYPSLFNDFAYDDLIHIVPNPLVQNSQDLWSIFYEPTFPGNLYRPLLIFSYALTVKYFGPGAFVFHLDNLLLHAANGFIVFILFRRVLESNLSFWLALLWLVHPINSEAVLNVSGRSELLAAFFVLLALAIIQKLSTLTFSPKHLLGLVVVIIVSAAATLSKESAICLALLGYLVLWRQNLNKNLLVSALLCFASLILGILIALYLRVFVAQVPLFSSFPASIALDNPLVNVSPLERLIIASSLLGRYIYKIFAPLPLSADYSYSQLSLQLFGSEYENLAMLVLLGVFLGLLYVGAKKNREILFFGSWFFLSFAVSSNLIFPIGTIFAERLLYLPSIGVLGVMMAFCGARTSPLAIKLIICSLVIPAIFITNQHGAVWKNNYSLFDYQIGVSANSAKTQHNYGIVSRNLGKLDLASLHFRKALEIYPNYADSAFGIATVYAAKGLETGAVHWLHEALKIEPQHAASYELLGKISLGAGQMAQARSHFEAALKANANLQAAWLGLVAIAIESHELTLAKELLLVIKQKFAENKDIRIFEQKLEELNSAL